jgi:hypothetical protein
VEGAIVQVAGDGSVVYRASALGMCTRALVAARQEYTQIESVPEKLEKTFAKGRVAEIQALQYLEREGWVIESQQNACHVQVSSKISIVGHVDAFASRKRVLPDGVVTMDFQTVEVKSQSKEEFENWSWDSPLWRKYHWQFSTYRVATDRPVLVVRWCRDSSEPRVAYYNYDIPFYPLEQLRARVLYVESLATQDVGEMKCDVPSFPCPVFYLPGHGDDVEKVDDPELEQLARDYKAASTERKIVDNRRRDIGKAILLGMGTRAKVVTNGLKISVARVKMPERTIAASEYDRITVTLPKEGQDGRGGVAGVRPERAE